MTGPMQDLLVVGGAICLFLAFCIGCGPVGAFILFIGLVVYCISRSEHDKEVTRHESEMKMVWSEKQQKFIQIPKNQIHWE